MSTGMTPEERRLIDEAIAAGSVTVCQPVVHRERREKLQPLDLNALGPSKQPVARSQPMHMSVREIVEWAFATERAQIEKDEIGEIAGFLFFGRGTEAVIAERHALGKVKIDVSPGRSEPAEAAQIVASVVRMALPWEDATWIASLARARMAPDHLGAVRPSLEPTQWVYSRGGKRGKTADSVELGTHDRANPHDQIGWPNTRRISRKRGYVFEKVLYTPCTWHPTASQIGHARRQYLHWWSCLLTVGAYLRKPNVLSLQITKEMPPMQPWRKSE